MEEIPCAFAEHLVGEHGYPFRAFLGMDDGEFCVICINTETQESKAYPLCEDVEEAAPSKLEYDRFFAETERADNVTSLWVLLVVLVFVCISFTAMWLALLGRF